MNSRVSWSVEGIDPSVRERAEAAARRAGMSQISNPQPARQTQLQDKQRQADMVERAATQIYRASPPLSPASLDFAIAEIAARQNELDGPAPRPMPPRSAPTTAPAMPPI